MIKDTNKSAHEIGFDVGTLVKGGGCAFPFVIELDDNKSMAYSHGMTLRDYFAAKALPECIGWGEPNEVCVRAYQYADAMLEARNN